MQLSPEGKKLQGSVGVDNVATMPDARLHSAGEGFPSGRRVLTYEARQRSAPAGA